MKRNQNTVQPISKSAHVTAVHEHVISNTPACGLFRKQIWNHVEICSPFINQQTLLFFILLKTAKNVYFQGERWQYELENNLSKKKQLSHERYNKNIHVKNDVKREISVGFRVRLNLTPMVWCGLMLVWCVCLLLWTFWMCSKGDRRLLKSVCR